MHPTGHGAFQGIKRSKGRTGAKTDILRASLPTLAERFAESGWRTGAFINNAQLGEFTGLNRGFGSYIPTAGKADRLIGIFLEWLEADLKRPAFAYLHFLEAHWPYKPRRRHVALFGGNRDTNYFKDYSARDYGRLRRAISHGEADLPDEHLKQMIQMYDGAIRRIDGKLKIILAMLTELGLRDDTAIIVTADHGDEFLEHGQIGHGQSLYNELTHVPLIAHIPQHAGSVRRP
ncbi:MAG: sulfatase-like hydrolase/transferase, partial [Planctomycetes bacterium]|nr:sulfatase-like hydrolase/transferase [Planctomycetota bacterium]